LRTKQINARNFVIDFVITTVAIVIALTFFNSRISGDVQEKEAMLFKADLKYLTSEISLVQNSVNQTLKGLKEKSKSANNLQTSLEEKSYRATDSLSMVVAQFDPNIFFRPEIIGFDAFVKGDEIKRLRPLSVRKSLLKSIGLLKKVNADYHESSIKYGSEYASLIDGQYTADRSRLTNRYFLYNGKLVTWLSNYSNELNKEIQQLKTLKQAFIQLEDQLNKLTQADEEENE
jgi:hypothetical protein